MSCEHVKRFDGILPYCGRCGKFWDEIDFYAATVTRIVDCLHTSARQDDDGRLICRGCGVPWRGSDDETRTSRSLIIASMEQMRRKPRGVDRRVLVSPETIARNDRMWAEHDREDAERALRRRSIFVRMREWLWGAR